MSQDASLQAADPRLDASVHASAGTGKTWLLVTRVLRLLLAGAHAEGILAVSFTRKAAAEMEQRIMERLHDLAVADECELTGLLKQAGITLADADTCQRAARLYEDMLCQPRRLRCTTFHAFCNDLLARFPLEAGVTPGFELVEKTGQLEQAAYEALLADSIRRPQHPVTQALDTLTIACESLDSAQKSLRSLLAQRSDWWAWTADAADASDPDAALDFAVATLTRFLAIDPGADPLTGYPDDNQRAWHRAFAVLLRDNTPTDAKLATGIDTALEQQLSGPAFLDAIRSSYLTDANTPRKRKASSAQQKRLGADREAHYLELHEQGCEEALTLMDTLARYRTLAFNTAWYRAGGALLEHYQRIKRERRTLDLTDLEWLACQLLNRSAHAGWVQYKLDARIDHLLVDEFQDTNPTQWRLLLPLLEELAAGDAGRKRSVFLVGDRKQSIYSFRRANPALLEAASGWLEQQRGAQRFPLNRSRRSAGAVMDCVNRVFTRSDLAGRLAEFSPHETWLEDVYGQVELLPLCTGTDPDPPAVPRSTLRNPLHEPRMSDSNQACLDEGRQIAVAIRQLLDSGATVEKNGAVRAPGYGDILILLRQRTHAPVYEQALREAGIPCLGASRGLLLDNLEVRDLVALLDCLVSPFDNLALAQVLRSPLFGLDSEQLLPLADHEDTHWYARLQQLAGAGTQPYSSVFGLLSHWRKLAGQLPVHDLLDRIFYEGEVLQRYTAAFPALLMPRVRASFTRFIELALEIDNGRYPSLPRFLDQLARLRASDRDQPDESAPDGYFGERVRLMTVHAAKGLEAPVVFLADAARVPVDRTAWSACVDWPPDAVRPQLMLLAAKKELRDSRTRDLLDQQANAAATEDANLLYVALTRARQYLFITGNARANAGNTGWYGALQSALDDAPRNSAGHAWLETGTRKPAGHVPARADAPVEIALALSQPVITTPRDLPIAPSRLALASEHMHSDPDGRERGVAIHLMLDRLTRNPGTVQDACLVDIANRLQRDPGDEDLLDWWGEACGIVSLPAFSPLFDATQFLQAHNEAPVQYFEGTRLVHGIIDRVIITDHEVLVIDYKTHRHAAAQIIPELVEDYRAQLACYAQAAVRLWPGRKVRTGLLFTACADLAWLDTAPLQPSVMDI
jgi:ATP-dependent helicase/nuclease subunit A